ncbi:hypothetical protein [Nitrospirillum pindoramense]|uniref:Uncharacterized protein n=1 Tax=Nitrospirillum amazonense TaxID=28077 RepID=A0A560HBM1_9PROT|nr:hypothetical protein [Nitrospirillum amazonense]TWB43755.1 hypothetical protein FBZ90_104143 [Nitrospirillum amazonense]
MSDPHDDGGGDPLATTGHATQQARSAAPGASTLYTAADLALARAAEMLLGLRGTRAYAEASPEERRELESYVLDLVGGRSTRLLQLKLLAP